MKFTKSNAMKLIYLLLVLALILNPLACASTKSTMKEESTNIEEQEEGYLLGGSLNS